MLPRRDNRSPVRWLGRHPLALLLSLAMLAGGIWGFAELTDEVFQGDTEVFDRTVLLSLREPGDITNPIGPEWVEELGRDITALGSVAVLLLISVSVFGYLLLEHKYRTALLLFVTVGGGMLASTLLKSYFERPRPELVPHETVVFTASFPSGHSMMSAFTYLTLAALLARIQPRRRARTYLFLLAVLLVVAIGLSRVYMGVHWPTDVLAGWSAGAIWALLCWEIARILQRRGRIEQAGVEPEVANDD